MRFHFFIIDCDFPLFNQQRMNLKKKMTSLFANSSRKGQLKIQQMAFVLVIIMIFFAMVGMIFASLWFSSLKEKAKQLLEVEARQLARSISGAPEFAFTSSSDCSSCIDLDKAFKLKDKPEYKKLWNIDYLKIERIYPSQTAQKECTSLADYPDNCNLITIVETTNYGAASTAYVALARWEPGSTPEQGYFKYEIGKVYISGKLTNT